MVIAPAAIAQARAVPMPQLVACDRPLKRQGGVWMTLCPIHGERTPSFAVYRDHGHCFGCGAHLEPIDWLRRVRGLDFAAAVAELAGGASGRLRGSGARWKAPVSAVADKRVPPDPIIARLWSEATDPAVARVYLRSRNLACEPLSEALRGHKGIWCAEVRETRPALLAAVEAPQRGIVALQRIWVRTIYYPATEPDARPLDLQIRKKTIGRLEDGAVRLAPAGDRLGLAEGIEDALAASKLYRQPCWAVLGVSRLGHGRPMRPPSVWIPPSVRELTIMGDRGEAGEEAALFAAWWYRRQGLQARALFPPEPHRDFADAMLCA